MKNDRHPPSTEPAGEQKPALVEPRITAAPKLRQIYWCEFWKDARLPEMWKTRPIVVVSYKNTLHGPCTVVPLSTGRQDGSSWAWELSASLDGRRTWVICDHPYTLSPSRFFQPGRKIPLVSEVDFNEILRRLGAWLPRPFKIDK